MNKKRISIYIDISEFLATRNTTGIQRVIRELLLRILKDRFTVKIIYYDEGFKSFVKIQSDEIHAFLKDVKNYQFKLPVAINIFEERAENKIFFDIDSVWNAGASRVDLYPKLKKYGFKIFNFIYDLIPVLFPDYLYEKSKLNFPDFIKAVYRYSDLVIFDSLSTQKDFFKLKEDLNIIRKINTDIVHLGSDYTLYPDKQKHPYEKLLSQKYILFVGTIEPRKQQLEVLKSFDILQEKYSDLNLVFIGRIGWDVDEFVNKIANHPLKNKRIYHLVNIEDHILSLFYQNAFIVTYLSNYEGFGLPVVESLAHSNITIISKNSSLNEVGNKFVNYIHHDIQETFIKLVSYYINDPNAFHLRKSYIKQNYKSTSWNDFYVNLINIFEKFDIFTVLVKTEDSIYNDAYKQ